jgi:putative ubiquitin-RnfH superfamily antitoxin RatB of RatAB toxin-antitoxin module
MGRDDVRGRAAPMRIEVAYSPSPRQVEVVVLSMPVGSTLAQALAASGLLARHRLVLDALRCGIWGREQPLDHPLRNGDRAEVYRALTVDPKEARRLRYKRQRRQPVP